MTAIIGDKFVCAVPLPVETGVIAWVCVSPPKVPEVTVMAGSVELVINPDVLLPVAAGVVEFVSPGSVEPEVPDGTVCVCVGLLIVMPVRDEGLVIT